MKKSELKQIIKEEISNILDEIGSTNNVDAIFEKYKKLFDSQLSNEENRKSWDFMKYDAKDNIIPVFVSDGYKKHIYDVELNNLQKGLSGLFSGTKNENKIMDILENLISELKKLGLINENNKFKKNSIRI